MSEKRDYKKNKPCSITIRDVAKEANTSISTVSRYLNDKGSISRETGKRIVNAIQRLHYMPNAAARALRQESRKTILLIVPDVCNPFYAQLAKTAQSVLKERGYAMVLYDSNDSLWEINAAEVAQELYVSGILFASLDIKKETIQRFRLLQIPVVLLCSVEESPFDMVHGDIGHCMYIATQHLIALGHRRIAFAGGNADLVHEQGRIAGYKQAMIDAGLPINKQYTVEVNFSFTGGYECGRILASRQPLPTAVCCANDVIALGLMSAMNEMGISIPDQVSVVGMDNIPYDVVSYPTLTSVTNNGEMFAKEGVRLLLERIESTSEIELRDILVHRELIIRGSVAACKEE